MNVRPWAPGDRFRPFGMKGSRKVKAVLTDAGVPVSERTGIHVLCDEDRIIWVVGCRMNEHFRIGSESERVLRIRYESAGR